MATLKTRTSEEVSPEVTITAEEIRAMIREKFPTPTTISITIDDCTEFLRGLFAAAPGYSEDQKYPVLYLLHGIGGDESEWTRGGPPVQPGHSQHARREQAAAPVQFHFRR